MSNLKEQLASISLEFQEFDECRRINKRKDLWISKISNIHLGKGTCYKYFTEF